MHRPGMDNAMQNVCKDLATAGIIAFGTDEYHAGTLKPEDVTDATIFQDFSDVLRFAQAQRNVGGKRLGVLGFCMGGRHAYLAAARYREIKAAVSYYGFPATGKDASDTPIELIESFKCPVLAIFGKQDHLFPFSAVEAFSGRLLSASKMN